MSKRTKLRTRAASLPEAGWSEIEILENMVQFYIFWTNTEEIFLVSGLIFYVFFFFAKVMLLSSFPLFWRNTTKIKTKQGQYHRNRSFGWCWCRGCVLIHVIPQVTILPAWVLAFLAGKKVSFQCERTCDSSGCLSFGKINCISLHVFLINYGKFVIFQTA